MSQGVVAKCCLPKTAWPPTSIGAVTDEALDAFSVCGTPDEFIPKIEGLAEMGVTQYVAGSPVGKNVEESIKLLGDVIASF